MTGLDLLVLSVFGVALFFMGMIIGFSAGISKDK